ncbi:hypothetical protein M5C97_07795 [Acidovorax sp. NCPPB 3859]|nr:MULTISPECIES: hypothetical protein [unclassified Acidovorax]MDA8453133.1 hypothetical protein [Acidovorax sp. GBBC 3297]MDA8462543.1 hypothetical protein [Acidovorax sp. GBBC 3333]MDA8467575.1 hypothetical protein [Acidovorax sp. GBBC 3332]MDA8472608.1 hypothetical protein [Acidovorax sp. GBBC 3299]WCM80179.1 hypothetical protein M5C94_07790 [Acidovorax sp. GBBC 712]
MFRPVDFVYTLIERLQQARPADAERINDIIALRTLQHRLPETSERELRLNEQRDGLGLALDIGGLDRAEVLKSMNIERAPNATSVLDLLDALPVHERTLLEHDSRIFNRLLGEQPVRVATFDNGDDRSVRVIVTDQMMLPLYSRPRPIRNKASGPPMAPAAPGRPAAA